MLNFGVHIQCYKNNKAVDYCLEQFRNYYPENPIRLLSDNGDDFDNLVEKYNIFYKKESKNILPKGKINGIDGTYEYLSRINDTCLLFDTEWILLMEEDVLTKGIIKSFPNTEAAGICSHPFHPELENHLKLKNNNTILGYGMCGGSIFKRQTFLDCYQHIDSFNLLELEKMDPRITGWSDIPLTVFFIINGYSYSIWDETEQPSANIYYNNSSFEHDFKKYY